MVFRFLCVSLLCVSLALAAPKRSTGSIPEERIAAYYVKDNDNGELRFLASGLGGTGTNGNLNSALNQYITQKQDLLEQLRPNNNNIGTTFGTGTTGTGLAGFTGTGATGGVTPIVVNLGNTGNTANNNAAITGASPITDLLPQIIAQAALGGGNNRRRVVAPNRRRVVASQNQRRRRPNRGGNKKNPVYVIRPRDFE